MTLRTIVTGLKSLFRGRRLNQEMDEELQSYLDSAVEEKVRRGMTRDEALREARAEMGSVEAVKQKVWAVGWESVIENLWRDLSFSARLLRKSPGFTAVAVLTLALGIGANTAVFSLINALLLRPLPVPHADELALIGYERADVDSRNYSFCAPLFRSLEKRHEAFQDIAAFADHAFEVRGTEGNQEIPGALVSGQFFHGMATQPLLGRYLTPQDDQSSGGSAGFSVVISEGFWRTWFNGASDVLGRRIDIGNAPFTVVGVMPKWFIGADPTRRPQIYAPLWAEPVIDAPYNTIAGGYHSWWLRIIARRTPGISLERANAALQAALNPILDEAASDPSFLEGARANHFHLTVEPGSKGYSYLSARFQKPLLAVFALCGAALLLACLNLASLLMARSAAREHELATRLAIGATRMRLIQQFFIESLLVAALGTAAGLAFAPVVSRSLVALLFSNFRGAVLDTALDFRVFIFATLITALATVLIGSSPALRATSGNLNDYIKDGSHVRSDRGRRLLPRLLMAMEVALALVLVTGAGLLAASLTRLYRTGLGFDPKGIVNVGLIVDKQPLAGDALIRWYKELVEAVKRHPGVRAVSYESITPLSGDVWTGDYKTDGSRGDRELYANTVAPAYFTTMRIPIFEGSDFSWDDTVATPRKIILNRAAAKVLFPGEDPIGRQVKHNKEPYEVIAVVGNVKYRSIRQEEPPGAYLPITHDHDQKKPSYVMTVRLGGPVAPFASGLRRLLAQMAPEIPAPVLTTMSGDIDSSISSERMMAMLSVFFAICALLVTAIGLYGTLSYATARRTSEIGIRIALGAQRHQVVSLIFRENTWIAAGGALAGLVVALISLRALASFLYGISAHDPWVMMFSLLILEAVASAASLIPAIRASRIEPITAIRCE